MKNFLTVLLTTIFLIQSCGNGAEKRTTKTNSTNEIWKVNEKDYSLTIELLDSVQYYVEKANSNYKPDKIKKITDFATAKKMLEGVVEFSENEHYIGLRRILFRNGEVYIDRYEEEVFSAYYPIEDIITFVGGHETDVSYNLKNGQRTEETGNPDYIVTSPNKKFRLNGFFDGQECVSYSIQKRIDGTFQNVISLNSAFIRNDRINLCQLKEAYWTDDNTLFVAEQLYYNGDATVKTKYYKVSLVKADKPIIEKRTPFQSKNPEDFIPDGYVIGKFGGGTFAEDWKKIKGDLNKDGLEDLVILIKGTDKDKIVKDEHNDKLDKNRRGIIILFNKGDYYELALQNYDCFSSENEDGGVYFPPELYFEIKKGNLYINYAHGRYGYWGYTFRYQNRDFELIGYDRSSHRGPITESDISINFLTQKLKQRENINENVQRDGDEIFKETKQNINVKELVRLSEIRDFDDIDEDKLYTVK
ncbi:hypothetical protein [Empedobacter brevis]|uniref:hypothetical protein n=1 Tax=Empedobacter brevis TaxID=247 RepID=UPI0039B002FF